MFGRVYGGRRFLSLKVSPPSRVSASGESVLERATPVVYLPGMFSAPSMFAPLQTQLSAAGFTTATLEIPEISDLDELLSFVHSELSKLPPHPVVVTEDVGAVLMQKYLESYALRGLVMVNPAPLHPLPWLSSLCGIEEGAEAKLSVKEVEEGLQGLVERGGTGFNVAGDELWEEDRHVAHEMVEEEVGGEGWWKGRRGGYEFLRRAFLGPSAPPPLAPNHPIFPTLRPQGPHSQYALVASSEPVDLEPSPVPFLLLAADSCPYLRVSHIDETIRHHNLDPEISIKLQHNPQLTTTLASFDAKNDESINHIMQWIDAVA